jgi:hypothetical protein
MCTSAPHTRAGRRAPAHPAGGRPRPAAVAGPMAGGIHCCAVLGSSAGRKHGTFRRCPSLAACSAANYDAKGPHAANCGGVGPHRKPAEYSWYDSQYSQHSAMVGRTLEVSTAPYPTLAGAVHAPGPRRPLSDGPRSLNARTSRPKTHLELHDRLADHREQPRRQRDQLRRELRVRHTGGGRRRRLPVPRQQHRHEELEPLHPHLRSFSRTRA